jgi:hypothetical protein
LQRAHRSGTLIHGFPDSLVCGDFSEKNFLEIGSTISVQIAKVFPEEFSHSLGCAHLKLLASTLAVSLKMATENDLRRSQVTGLVLSQGCACGRRLHDWTSEVVEFQNQARNRESDCDSQCE